MNRTIRNVEDWKRFAVWFGEHPDPYPFRIVEGEGRTLNQNALLHVWFGEIAKQSEGETMLDVKGRCHREYGLPIRLRDAQFAWIWERTGAHLDYEKQCSLLASGVLNVSSGMTTKELNEYLDTMQPVFATQGVRLTTRKEGE